MRSLENNEDFLEKNIIRTEHYKFLKSIYGDDEEAIMKVMNTPVEREIFSWNSPRQTKDTLISPIDSLIYYKQLLHSSLISINPYTGEIKAWVGGINHNYFKFDHVNQSKRQPGSAFKPILYSLAIETDSYRFHPCAKVLDVPITILINEDEEWTPNNSNNKYSNSYYTLRRAMALSINSVAAYLIREIGPQNLANYASEKFDIQNIPAVYSLCLGTAELTLKDLVGSYTTFVNRGTWIEPHFINSIEDKHGNTLYSKIPNTIESMSKETAYKMIYMLRGSVEESGGTSARINRYDFSKDNEVGGKTGTTDNHADAWYIGVTNSIVSGVWVGAEDEEVRFRNSYLGQGSTLALPIFADYTEKLYNDKELRFEKGKFQKPEDLTIDCNSYD